MKPKNKAEKPATEPQRFEFVQCIGTTQKGQEIEAWVGIPVDNRGKVKRLAGHPVYFDNVTLIGKRSRRIFSPGSPVGVKA